MSVNLPLYVTGLGLVVLSLSGLLVLLRRTRRKPPAPAVEEPVVEAAPEAPAPEEPHPDVRALRAQVRVLEEALQRAADATVEQPELAAYRTQVRAAVEAVARRTPAGADARTAVARVGAAVARLDADPSARVVLPAQARRPAVVAAVAAPVVPEPVLEQAAVEMPAVVDATDAVEPVEEEVVLPVPPPAPAETRRSRRRLRRSAA
jgi:hypothetical protein